MEETTKQAFSEVYDIIEHMEEKVKEKIPKGFINFIKENMDLNYKIKIDYSESLGNQNLLHETKVLLSLIYRDYICDKKNKERLMQLDDEEIKRQEGILREKYKIDFDKIKEQRETKVYNSKEDKMEEKSLVMIKEERWYKKIIKNILELFTRKK